MRNLKRTLSLLLTAAMLIGMMVVGASAASSSDFTDSDEITNIEAAQVMTALGVFEGTDSGAFWSQMESSVDVFHDILNGFVKSVVFGIAVTLVALYEGYTARPTPDGVARATTTTVVVSSLLVLALDFIMTAWMFTTV